MPIFSLFEDPTYYPNDIYVHHSLVAGSSYLYPLLSILGPLASNTYFIFLLHTAANLINVFFIFKIVELLFPNLRKYDIGLIALLLFLYDYPIFMAYSQIVLQFSFSQTTIAMPILSASLYYFLKGKLLTAVFLSGVLAAPLHFKSAWFIFLMIVTFIIFSYKKLSSKKTLVAFFLSGIVVLIMSLYRGAHTGNGVLTFSQLLEMCEGINKRDLNEIVVLMNPWWDFVKLFLVFFGGWKCVSFVEDVGQRFKLSFFYVLSLAVFAFGTIYTSYFYKVVPIPEVLLLSFPRMMALPLIISIILIGGALLTLFIRYGKNAHLRWLVIFALFVFAYFPNFKKSIVIYLVCIAVAYVLVYRSQKIPFKMGLKPLTAFMYSAVFLFLMVRAGGMVLKSYKEKAPFFPLTVFNLERPFYDAELWAKEHTPKDSVFLCFKEGSIFYHEHGFRRFSGRTMLFGDYNSFYLNYDLIQEHKKRELFRENLMRLIQGGNKAEIIQFIAKIPWRLDYIMLSNKYSLPYPTVYFNEEYTCYWVGHKDGSS